MGSLETGISLKIDNHLHRSSSNNKNNIHPFLQRPRSRFSRFLLFKKLDYLQWICAVAAFCFFVLIFQMFLPEKSGNFPFRGMGFVIPRDFEFLKEMGGFDFGEDVQFDPSRLLAKFKKEDLNFSSAYNRTKQRFGFRNPQLALVFVDLLIDPHQILMVSVAAALKEIGYAIQVYSLEDGPAQAVWEKIGVPVIILQSGDNIEIPVDWLKYDGILVNSLEAKGVISRIMQEPFKSLPLIWTIHEDILANRIRQYNSSGQIDLMNDWKRTFSRATVVVFSNYVLPMMYSSMDAGNFFVIPGSPAEVWEADNIMAIDNENNNNLRAQMGYGPDDVVITIVGSQILYRGLWLEHALVLQALFPVLANFPSDNINSNSQLKIVVLSGDSTGTYSVALEAMALNLRYPRGIVKHVAIDGNEDSVLGASNLVIYGCFHEEQSFPDILIKAMSLEKTIVAPDLSIIRKYVDDRVNGYLFPMDNINVLTETIVQIISNGKISPLSLKIALTGKGTAKNLMALQTIEGYAWLIENILRLPSEVAPPKTVSEIPASLKEKWQWHLFDANTSLAYVNSSMRSCRFLNMIEQQWNRSQQEGYSSNSATDESFVYSVWEEEKYIEMAYKRKRIEDDELKARTDQSRGTWEDVYRNAKKADRTKNDLHERDDGELERTGQPLTIYEPYLGEGAWPFLHRTSLYRGIGLSTKGRRPEADDIDAPARLPLLSNPYYRDALGQFGAFFALANRIDRVHKNSWIGFQSWRGTAAKVSLSKVAEKALLDDIQARRHGDTLYFWARMDKDQRNPLQRDFWSFCDATNAGNCKYAVSEALKKMYGITHDLNPLPYMPVDGTWSVMNSWALPTKSFLEFVMFSRIFVDALDAQVYNEHHKNGHCYLSLYKDKHCYSRVLELLINVWAYHSARRIVYIHPDTGMIQEHHKLKTRKGHMWIKWFSYTTLKSMDEDLAEESDIDTPSRRWLWPMTGEVFWQGIFEREKNLRHKQKEKKKQESKDKIRRMKKRSRQKVIGKYVKPPPDEFEDSNSNSTDVDAIVLR